ncbi:MAG: N-acetylmuramoyl-L-alanine amidase [Alphaproteobacteria bacterium]|nr:MAG: N-acetylmuramoyl-L-alanine amidase [Alphaproteobacteria bacterium]TAF76516.1 MAG: N-acetylmuramoyl-L-alanine amidase [Alphaproteobacteria bacterium]
MILHIRLFNALFSILLTMMLMCVMMFLAYGSAAYAVTITRMTLKRTGLNDVVSIYTNDPLTRHSSYILDNPMRLVIDMNRVTNGRITLPKIPANSSIHTIRFSPFDERTSRIVLDLARPLASHQRRMTLGRQGRESELVLTLEGKNVPRQHIKQNVAKPAIIPIKAKSKIRAISSRLPLIAIDAGHGGKDPGAIGRRKTLEKNITLAYAQAVERMVKNTGRYRTMMIRDDDSFIFLDDRVRLAREAQADLFISLHADTAGEASARGISVYTVSQQASDGEAAKLAAHENEADKIGGIAFAEDNPEVADILIDLASRDARIKANDLASYFIKQCGRQAIRRLKNPNRHAGFRVLKAPDVPSILIEVGFLSNPEDEKTLARHDHRTRVSRALLAALDTYFLQHPKQR